MSIEGIERDFVCRFCLEDVKSKRIKTRRRDKVIEDINSILNLEIYDEDDWPKSICNECKEKSKDCVTFFRKIKETEKKLLEIFGEKFKDSKENVIYLKENNPLIMDVEIKEEVIENESEAEMLEENDIICEDFSQTTSPESEDEDDPPKTRKKETKKSRIIKENNDVVEKYLGFKCDICSKSAKSYYKLKHHFRMCHGVKGYLICCTKKFTSLGRLAGHLKLHANPEAFKCPVCSKVLHNANIYREHVNDCSMDPKKYSVICNVCLKAFPSKRLLRNHRLQHAKEEDKKHKCPECPKRYLMPSMLKHHYARVHSEGKESVCEICGKGFPTKGQIKMHLKIHFKAPQPKIRCDHCYGYYTQISMYSHRRHCNVQPATCEQCGKKCINKPALKEHIRYTHEGVKRKSFTCEICSKTFSTRRKLVDHTAKHQGIAMQQCRFCDKKFYSASAKSVHQRTIHPAENEAAKIRNRRE